MIYIYIYIFTSELSSSSVSSGSSSSKESINLTCQSWGGICFYGTIDKNFSCFMNGTINLGFEKLFNNDKKECILSSELVFTPTYNKPVIACITWQ